MTTKSKKTKTTETSPKASTKTPRGKVSEAKRKAAVAVAQAIDAAANAHATKIETTPAMPVAKTEKVTKIKKPRKPSGLDTAYQVLKAKGEPMTCKAIVDEMLTQGLWSTSGKTPAATIYSAILREIDGKPGESRFAKTGRGLFTLSANH